MADAGESRLVGGAAVTVSALGAVLLGAAFAAVALYALATGHD